MTPGPITAKDISIKQVEEGQVLEIRACLHLTCQCQIDPAELRKFPEHRERILEDAEGKARSYIAERVYGKVRSDAQAAYETLRNLAMRSPHLTGEFAKTLNTAFDPLLHAGSELVILQKELEPERFDMEKQIETEAS